MTSTEVQQLNPLEVYRASTPPVSPEVVDAALDYLAEIEATVPTPPCPTWCEKDAGHGYTADLDVTVVSFQRFHMLTMSKLGAEDPVHIHALEDRSEDGAVTLGEPEIFHESACGKSLSGPAAAYAFGDALIAAARKLEQIKAAEL